MIKTGNSNINSQEYWNSVYGDKAKRAEYASIAHAGEYQQVGEMLIRPTFRMQIALEQVKKGDKVLDLGCGVGVFTKLVKDKFPDNDVWGIDISNSAIEDNKKENPNIHYFTQVIGEIDLPTDFDLVFAGEILEHLDDPSLLLKDAYKCLKKGGKLILTTPLTTSVHSGEHVWFFDKSDITKLFVDAGFKKPKFIDLPDLEYLVVIFAVSTK